MHHLGRIGHERQVRRLAIAMFDLTLRRHRLGSKWRTLLSMAAIVHDVGRADGARGHRGRGARMVDRERALPLGSFERRVLAYLVRYHSGPLPRDAGDKRFHNRDRKSVQVLLAILRAADALDSRTMSAPRLALSRRGRAIHIRCHVDAKSQRARLIRRREHKFELLEQVLNQRVRIQLKGGPATRQAA